MTAPRIAPSGAWNAAEGARRAAALFARGFGAPPDGVWSAPGRVNLIGEHTDHQGGLCLPMAIPQRTYVAVRRVPGPGPVRAVSGRHPGGAGGDGWRRYVTGAVREAERMLAPGAAAEGWDVAVESCVPEGAGLSSSAALLCAVATAVAGIRAGGPAGPARRRELAAAARRAEHSAVGVPAGPMDHAAAMLSRAGHALLLDCADGAATTLPFDAPALGVELLVIDTGTTHALVDGGYARRLDECAAAARALGVPLLGGVGERAAAALTDGTSRDRALHVVRECARVRAFAAELSRPSAGTPARLGALLDASHASLRDLFAVSTPVLDATAAAARAAGAHGARMTGAGFGGSVLALVPAGAAGRIARAVADSARPAAEPGDAAAPAPRFLRAVPSDGARRDR